MDLDKLHSDLQTIVEGTDEATFIYDLLLAYGLPKSSITRLKKGDLNKSADDAQIVWRKKLCFRQELSGELLSVIDDLQRDVSVTRHRPRFIIVTNFKQFLAVDTLANDTLDIRFEELPKYCDFFLPWAGMEKATFRSESPVDIKAAETMGKLYELILLKNPPADDETRHALNIFFVRLLFCFFAEDTGIFSDDLFTKSIAQHTKDDGSSLQAHFERLFRALDTQDKSEFPLYLQEFPYVGGNLFDDDYPVPAFNEKARQIIVDCGALDWKAINPDIFGSMLQAVTHADTRGSAGMHYTSVVNIMKVIEPLFLNELRDALADAEGNEKKLVNLLGRIYKLKIFDPACGSGNFLIIAFKELCRLEIDIFLELQEIDPNNWSLVRSGILLTQFYGIEIDDLAHETAKLSLWLAEHQMNLEFEHVFGEARPTLPLEDSGTIVCANATRIDWSSVCKPEPAPCTVYLLGNPPYVGFRNQDDSQKADMAEVLGSIPGFKSLDYVACWFLLGANYISGITGELGFVSTNSITQGAQVAVFWPEILGRNVEISFAHLSFLWTNNARGAAGVTCVVIGLRNMSRRSKYIYHGSRKRSVSRINSYLIDADNVFVCKRSKPLSDLPKITDGCAALDGGNLVLSSAEREKLLETHPEVSSLVRSLIGSSEFVGAKKRYCLWISDDDLGLALGCKEVKDRIEHVRLSREGGGSRARSCAGTPHRFAWTNRPKKSQLLIPTLSTERRNYIPVGYVDLQAIVSNLASIVHDADPYIFSLVSSRIHMVWVRAVAGRFRSHPRYTSALCYNTFPVPSINTATRDRLEAAAFQVMDQREKHSEMTLAELYDPEKMPKGLLQSHRKLDEAVDACYRREGFPDDEERLQCLFQLYKKMIEEEQKSTA